MTPSTWVSFFFFTYLLVPGLYLDYLSRRRRPDPSETPLREVGRVVLGSLIFSTLSFLIISLARWWHPSWMPDPRLFLLNGHDYLIRNYRLVFRTLVIEELLALGSVWIYDNAIIILKKPLFTRSHHWEMLFNDSNAKTVQSSNWVIQTIIEKFVRITKIILRRKHPPLAVSESSFESNVVTVTLNSESEVIGFVTFFSNEESMDDRELLMTQIPFYYISYLPLELQDLARKNNYWHKMYIPIQSIEKIAVIKVKFPNLDDTGAP